MVRIWEVGGCKKGEGSGKTISTDQITLSPATSWDTCTSLRAYRSLEGFTGGGTGMENLHLRGLTGLLAK